MRTLPEAHHQGDDRVTLEMEKKRGKMEGNNIEKEKLLKRSSSARAFIEK